MKAFQKIKRLALSFRSPISPEPESPPNEPANKDVQKAYVESVLKKICSGRPHASLGSNISNDSKKKALATFEYLIASPLGRDEIVVDYGCGTLRIGRHLINYLSPCCYVGMDLDEKILDAGLQLLDKKISQTKQPLLLPISRSNIIRVAELVPTLIFAKGVLQHIPPSGIDEFFANVAAMASQDTKILIMAKISSSTKRLSERSWIHSREDIIRAAVNAQLFLVEVDENKWHRFRLNNSRRV